jgi:hypothetical protein
MVRDPVLLVPASLSVSVVMESVWLKALLLKMVMAVPMGNATELLAGITILPPTAVVEICVPASAKAKV